MKKGLWLGVLFWLALTGTLTAEMSNTVVQKVSPLQAHQRYKTGNVILIDSMPVGTFNAGHILSAINFPYDGREDLERIREMDLPFPLEQEIFVYCG